jgi:5-formyltetrahydrofolate cyclo-ligase
MAEAALTDWPQIRAWRKTQRAELVQRREVVPVEERRRWNERMTAHLLEGFALPAEAIVGICWPYKGEFDARHAVRHWRQLGAAAALPEVVQSKAPLQFRRWWPGAPLRPGVYDIPVPDGTEIVVPDVAVVPMNGFDERGFRLGYGGGFFDRTLSAVDRRMIAIGVAYEVLRLTTIYPQTHDVPMDFVVTEAAIYAAGGAPLQRIDAAQCRQRFERLLLGRRLPRALYGGDAYSSPACYAADFPGYWGEDAGKPEGSKE